MNTPLDAIHISSFDFDGCILPQSLNLSVHTGLKAALQSQNTLFKVNIGMIGSNRQDKRIDDVNRHGRSEVASAFKTLPDFFAQQGMTFDPVLLADVYHNQAHGLAFQNAITSPSPDTYHPQYVFDEFKSTLIYFQIHQAALNACSCDFIVLEKEPTDFHQLSKRSNAAYVYCKDSNQLFYINTLENRCDAVPGDVSKLLALYQSPDIMQRRNCFEQNTIFGFRLNDDELKALSHHHTKHYPIYFDFYDDREDILNDLKNLFEKNPALLPANVVLRLHHYDVAKPLTTTYLLEMNTQTIKGQGKINLDPSLSLRQLATKAVGFSPESFSFEGYSAVALSEAMTQKEQQATLLANQNIETALEKIDPQLGLIQEYLPGEEKLKAHLMIYKKSLENSWFLSNQQYPVWEQKKAINALWNCLDNPSGAFLMPSQKAVLEHGHLGQLLKKSGMTISDSWIKKSQEGLATALENYKLERQKRSVSEYTHFFGACSKREKFNAIDILLMATQPRTIQDKTLIELNLQARQYQKALTQGQLAKTLAKNNIQVSFVDDRTQVLACLSSNILNLDTRLKKIAKIKSIINQHDLTPNQRAAGLIFAFALSTQSKFAIEKGFGDTASMHRFCHQLLNPNTFSYALREEVFKLAGLDDGKRLELHQLALQPIHYFGDSNRSKESENLRQKLLGNMANIFSIAKPVLQLAESLNADDICQLNQDVGSRLGFR